jgi:hypothetical protein
VRQPTKAEQAAFAKKAAAFEKSIAKLTEDQLRQNLMAMWGQMQGIYWKYEELRGLKRRSKKGSTGP